MITQTLRNLGANTMYRRQGRGILRPHITKIEKTHKRQNSLCTDGLYRSNSNTQGCRLQFVGGCLQDIKRRRCDIPKANILKEATMNVTCGIKVLDGSIENSFTSGKKDPRCPVWIRQVGSFIQKGLKKVLRSQALHLPHAPTKG